MKGEHEITIEFMRQRAEWFVAICKSIEKVFGKQWGRWGHNPYHSDFTDPWIKFEHKGAKLTIGARKRVTSIGVKFDQPVQADALKALAERDHVTFISDDRWNGPASASEFQIHAWGPEKRDEYLEAIRVLIEPDTRDGLSSVSQEGEA